MSTINMEVSAMKNKSFIQPKPLAELLPELSGILTKDAVITLTARKQPRSTMVQTRTTEKVYKPLTLAQMKAEMLALDPLSRRKPETAVPSAKKKGWNSSIKLDKKIISHTSEGQLKNNPVRKVLNFQPKPKPIPSSRMTMLTTETPKFPKPEFRAKKSLHHLQAKNTVRISGICNIPQTPIETIKAPNKSRMTIANKENTPYQATLKKLNQASQTPKFKKIATPKIDTPASNSSWKTGSDSSFLLKEKEINDVEAKVNAIIQEETLENIAEVSPPVSTPFKEYRSVQEYFNNSSCVEDSVMYNDNTIMCFDKPSTYSDNEKREESVIVSLCDLFTKASMTNAEKSSTELDNLLEVEKQTEHNIKMIESGIQMLTKIKEAQVKSLQNVKKLISEKNNHRKKSESDKDKTLISLGKEENVIDKTLSPDKKSPILSRPCSVIKSNRSPSYKIPKKNLCLRKKVICKSMPNVSGIQTPVKDMEGQALNMYMKMKEQMNFLSTPMVNRENWIPDTPAVTSHNLQKQLDKLYGS